MLTVKKRTYIHKFFQLAGIETTLKKEENVNKLKESFKTLYIHIFLLIQYSLDWTEWHQRSRCPYQRKSDRI